MRHFADNPHVRFVHAPVYLDGVIRELDELPDETVREIYEFFRKYYFAYNDDRERLRPFEERLEESASASSSYSN
jgi:hypothetical protein